MNNDSVKSKFTKGDKKEIIKMFEEVKNNRAKNAIEKLIKKINELKNKGDERLKNVYGKKLTNEQRNLMQEVGKLYNSYLPNKNTLKRNLALYIAYMHAKKPSPFPIKWKGVTSYPILSNNPLSKNYVNVFLTKLQGYKNKPTITNNDLKNIKSLLKKLKIAKSSLPNSFTQEKNKKYENLKQHFNRLNVKNLSEIQSQINQTQRRSQSVGPAAAEVYSQNINKLRRTQKIGGAAYKVNKQKTDTVPNLTANQLKSALTRQMYKFNTKKRSLEQKGIQQSAKMRIKGELKPIKEYIKKYTKQAQTHEIFKTDETFKKNLEKALKYLSAGG